MDKFNACILFDQQIRAWIIVMYVSEKIIDLYCSTFSTDSYDGQKVVAPQSAALVSSSLDAE